MQTANRIIEQQRDRLSPSETRVADFILSEPNPISQMSVGELARRVGVSEPTVIRLCRRLGYKGFRDFKDALLARITPSNTVLHREISTSDSPQLAASKVLESCARSLLDVSGISQNLPFEMAAERLRSASHIVFAGLGASGLVAQDAVHKFFRLGIPCRSAVDTPTILQSASIARRGETFVFVSQTGEWPELIQALKQCRDQGASTIALTRSDSALAIAADMVFACDVDEDTHLYTPMNSRLVALAILDAIQVSLAIALGEPAETNLRASKSTLNQHIQKNASVAL